MIQNPAGADVTVTLKGSIVAGSCTTADSSYSETCELDPNQPETHCELVEGLNTGIWKHWIEYTVGTLDVKQYQRGNLVFHPTDEAEIGWTYFPKAIQVNKAGDAASGTCPVNAPPDPDDCDIRDAIGAANGAGSVTEPLLIMFDESPGSLSGADLIITRQRVTVDGSNTNGDPWIVADPGRAAQGLQSPFPTNIEFPANEGFEVQNSEIVFRGLDIEQTVSSGVGATHSVIELTSSVVDFRLENSRVNGGMGQTCEELVNNCSHTADGIRVPGRTTPLPGGASGLTLNNVEILSAVDKGIELGAHSMATIYNSWLHNNYKGNLLTNAPQTTSFERSFIERAGLRSVDDLLVQDAPGIVVERGGSDLPTSSVLAVSESLIRNNSNEGVAAQSSSTTLSVGDSSFCGNGLDGLYTEVGGTPSGAPVITGVGGIGASYNGDPGAATDRRHGFNVLPETTTNYDLDEMSAFVSNTECGLFNRSETVAIKARFNQWEGYADANDPYDPNNPFFDECEGDGGGEVDASSPRGHADTGSFSVATSFPSDVALANQTIRIIGQGFDAIFGNPSPGEGCDAGVDGTGEWNGEGVPQPSSCCNDGSRSNYYDNGESEVVGNHVQLLDSQEVLGSLVVKAVTPRLIEAVLSQNINCRGDSGEVIKVTKNDDNGMPVEREADYCIPTAPL